MVFTGREVRMGKTCARGLEYGPRPRAQFFSHTGQPSPVNNIFFFFFWRGGGGISSFEARKEIVINDMT